VSRDIASLIHYQIPREVLTTSRALLAEIGAEGLEGVVVWVGRRVDATHAEVERVLRPEQLCFRTAEGVGVEVPPESIGALISALEPETSVLARLHTHPGYAYHSDVDDVNMLVAHQGAISIVVPDFASAPIKLTACSVNELRHGEGWIELSASEVTLRFEIL
jgi:hypothetical protein